jgi:hypothetical protein
LGVRLACLDLNSNQITNVDDNLSISQWCKKTRLTPRNSREL